MKVRTDTTYEIDCHNDAGGICYSYLQGENEIALIRRAEQEGWVSYTVAGEEYNFCPKCKGPNNQIKLSPIR